MIAKSDSITDIKNNNADDGKTMDTGKSLFDKEENPEYGSNQEPTKKNTTRNVIIVIVIVVVIIGIAVGIAVSNGGDEASITDLAQ